MELTVLGCRGSTPYKDPATNMFYGTSSYLVTSTGGTRILLDIGEGADAQLQALGLRDEPGLSALLTHEHHDHDADVKTLAQNREYPKGSRGEALPPREDRIPFYVPAGTKDDLDVSTERRGYPRPLSDAYEFHTLASGVPFQIGDVTVTPALVDHLGMDAYGFRLDDGEHTLVYSGDTGPCDALVDLAMGADLALFEAFYTNSSHEYDGLHLTGGQAAEAAMRADVGSLLLTHHHPSADASRIRDEAAEVFTGSVTSAAQDVTYRVGERLPAPPSAMMELLRANKALYDHVRENVNAGRRWPIDWRNPPVTRRHVRETDIERMRRP